MTTQKKMRSLKMGYAKQQMIYRTCRRYDAQPPAVQEKIERLCYTVTHGDRQKYRALFAVLTSGKSIRRIALEHYYSERLLYDLRRAFYEAWNCKK